MDDNQMTDRVISNIILAAVIIVFLFTVRSCAVTEMRMKNGICYDETNKKEYKCDTVK